MVEHQQLPPLPEPAPLSPERRTWLAEQRRHDLPFPAHWRAALAAHGWLHAGGNRSYVFFERPGHWLRLSRLGEAWVARIDPETHRVPRPELGSAGLGILFPQGMQPPEYRGRGARTRALEAAKALWLEHEPYLAALGVELHAVGVRLFRGSGRGGYVASQAYRRGELGLGGEAARE